MVARISVLMSVKNGERFLDEAILSILNQTYREFEFIIVDNASVDSSASIIRAHSEIDPRIIFIQNEVDLGHSGGLNRGLEVCRSAWVARMDADDIAYPNRLERQISFLEKNKDVVVTSCLAYHINEHGNTISKTYHDLTTRESFTRYMKANEAIGLLHPGAVIRRDTLMAVGGYRQEFGGVNDIDLWARISERQDGLILVQPEYLMKYRVHANSLGAHNYLETRLKYEWARVAMRARRVGRNEPSWDEFLSTWNNAPLHVRLNRCRKTYAKYLYRSAGVEYSNGRRVKLLINLIGAFCLQPAHVLNCLKGNRL